MRAEDKRIGSDIDAKQAEVEQLQRQDRAQESEQHLEQLDDLVTLDPAMEALKAERCQAMMGILDAIFHGDRDALARAQGFSSAEMEALSYFQAAVSGRDTRVDQLVYAEDRKDLLEQALAVLYPTLSHGMEQSAIVMREVHDALIQQVVELRHEIASKEDAQESVIELRQYQHEETKGDGDKDDDDDDGDTGGSGDGDGAGAAKPGDADDDDAPAGDVGDSGVVVP